MSTLAIGITVSELVAVLLAWRVLRSADPLPLKIGIALVAFIPFIGPLMAYWAANFPNRHHPAFLDRYKSSSDVFSRWSSVLSMTDPEKRMKRLKEVLEKAEREAK
jgi:hypothetical protein